MDKKILTEDLIPDDFSWAAIDSFGRAYAFSNKPKLTSESWKIDCDSEHFNFINTEIYLGKDFYSQNWKESLIMKFKRLKSSNIPSDFKYAAIDEDGQAYAYKSKPMKIKNCWTTLDETPFLPIGNFYTEDWTSSLVENFNS